MKKLAVLGVVLAVASPAMAGYAFFENFESGVGGWTSWNQTTRTPALIAEAEGTALGSISPESGANAQVMHQGNNNYNGGAWKAINLSAVAPTKQVVIDAFTRSHAWKASYMWAELVVYDSATWTPTNGTDINTNSAIFKDGNLTNGEMIYKTDTYAAPYNSAGWNGQWSTVANNYEKGGSGGNGALGLKSAIGNRLVVVLKTGNGQSATTVTSIDFDDVYLTPEPATLMLLGVPAIFLRRRRA
jgi:hypothetical protein